MRECVAVYSSQFNGLTRAKVTSVNDSPKFFRCSLIDFGRYESIVPRNVFELPNDYTIDKVRRIFLNKINVREYDNFFQNLRGLA